MGNHLVRERPLGHTEMSRAETIVLAAGAPRLWRSSSDSLVLLGGGDDRLFLQCVQRPSGALSGRKGGTTASHERGVFLPRMQRPMRPLRSRHQADHG